MRFDRLLAIALLPALPLSAQQVAPADEEPAPIAPVEPVPIPDAGDLLDADQLTPARPETVHFDLADGFDYDPESGVLQVRGQLVATADTGMTLRADRGRYEAKAGRVIASGAVKLATETGVEIFADHAVLDEKAGTVTLTGDVSVYQGATVQRSQRVIYHIEDDRVIAEKLKTGVDPILLEAGQFTIEERDGQQVFVGQDAGVTTHDVEDPGFWVRSSETTVYPDDRVTFRNMKVYAGDVPVFWLPYFSQPLDGDLGYHFIPGARTNWGAYLLNRYGVLLGRGEDGEEPWLLSRWNLDLRSRRGIGAGVDLVDRRIDNDNLTGLSLYYTNDLDPTISRTGLPRPFLNEDRWRAKFAHRVPLDIPADAGADWRLDFNLDALSDNYFLEDFDPRTFSTDPNPDNTIGLFRRDESSLLGVHTRVRPNDFYRSDTRLPEISFEQSRRPIFDSPILHEGQTTLGFVQEEIGSATAGTVGTLLALPAGSPLIPTLLDQLPPYERQLVLALRALPPGSPTRASLLTQLLEPGYSRFHTYQEVSMPTDIGGWLHLTPEFGMGYSSYWAANGPSSAFNRFLVHAGAEASLKFTRDFGDHRSSRWGLDGLLHVVQPYGRFSFLNTDDLDNRFPFVDRETFSTRPRTLEPNRFTAVDSLRDWSILRLGVRNRLLTRRDGQTWEWLALDTYFDAFIDDPDFNRNFSNLYNDLDWNPLPWLGVRLETQFPVINDGSGFSEVVASLRFMPTENLEFSVGNRYLDNHPVLVDSNRINFKAYARLTDDWGVGAQQIWELDDGILELQQYTIHKDFNHWVASMGFTHRDNRVDDEYGVIFALTLKDFPSATLPFRLDAQ